MPNQPTIDPNRTAAHIAGPVTSSTANDLPDIAGYIVFEELARGGMGRVLAATDLTLDREVAIKVLLPGTSIAEAAGRFVRESKITGKLAHPGIPPVHTLGTLDDGSPYLAMKLIRGRTLDQLLKLRESPTDNLPHFVQVFEQICQAVGFAHSQQIIHRDLKPANVMVGAFGEVQVMDWGLAKDTGADREAPANIAAERSHASVESRSISPDNSTPRALEETQPGDILGTITYMPPEQAKAEFDRIGPWSDVFSLGGILCHILTGKPPYHGFPARTLLVLAEVCDTSAAFAKLDACGADPELISLCQRCLAKNPMDRFADGIAVAASISAYRAGVEARLQAAEREAAAAAARTAEEVNTRREAEAKLIEQRRKQRFQFALAAAIGLLVLGGVGFAWYQQWSAGKQIQLEAARDREETDKRAAVMQTRERVPGLLALAVEQRKRYRFKDAAKTLVEARNLAGGGLTDDLIPIVAETEEQLELVVQLDDIRMKRSTYILDIGGKGHFDSTSAAPAYRKAFLAHGFDLEVGDPAEVAARVAASPIKAELVAALDDWAVFESKDAIRDAVLSVARLADPGSWSDRFRDPATRSDPMRLWWLARRADPVALPPATTAALAELMRRRGLDATRVLSAAQSAHPTDFILAFHLALLVNESDHHAAIVYYRVASVIRPENFAVLNNLGNALSKKGDMDGALAAYRAAIEIEPKYKYTHSQLGNALLKTRDLEGAIAEYLEAIRIDPMDATFHYNLGIVLEKKGDLNGAIAACREAVRLNPDDSEFHNNLGVVLGKSGDTQGAIAEYLEAIRLDPKFAIPHFNLGTVLSKQKDLDGAIAEYRKAILIDPNYAIAHDTLGLALSEKGDLDGAIASSHKAIRLVPTDAVFHNNLGVVLDKKGDRDGAIAAYRESIRLDPEDAITHFNLGVALHANDDLGAAMAEYREAIRLDPNHVAAHVNLGIALFETGDLDGSITEYRKAIRIDSKDLGAHYNLGNALLDQGDLNGAIAEYREAITINPKYAGARLNLGIALSEKGDLDGAFDEYRAAIEIDPTFNNAKKNLTILLKVKARRDAVVTEAFGIAIPATDRP